MNKPRSVFCLLVTFLVSFLSLSAQEKPKLPPDIEKALNSIQGLEAYQSVKILASREFAGRLTGHEGYTAAARWAAGKFKQWGLLPIDKKDGYLQLYPSPYTVVKKAEMTLFLPDDKGGMKLEANKDFLPLFFTDSGQAEAALVFAGWGISAPDLGYDDYAGIDVQRKFVLCFRGVPDGSDRRFQIHDEHRTRMKTAKDKGALGLVYIYPEPISNPNGDWIQGFMPIMLSEKITDLLLKEKSVNSVDLRKDLQSYKKPLSFPLRPRIRYAVESEHFPDGIGYNIAGYVEGRDAKLKKECLVVGGHFDHDGLHMGFLFPGADDNASGSATVMEIARAYARLAQKPKRSVMFVLFGGEEMGLQGSTYFADHLPQPFEKVDAMFNFDMTGEGDGAGGACSANRPELKKALQDADMFVGILRGLGEIRSVGVRSSDFAPFFLKGTAAVSIGSNGPHLAYHAIGDTIYRINPDIMADIARLAFLASRAWADR